MFFPFLGSSRKQEKRSGGGIGRTLAWHVVGDFFFSFFNEMSWHGDAGWLAAGPKMSDSFGLD